MHPLASIAEKLPQTLTLVVISVVAIEWIALSVLHKIDSQKESWVNLFSAALAFLPQFLISKVVLLAVMFWGYEHRLFDLGMPWYVWGIAWVIYDFNFWLVHFLSHKVRLFWCLHNVHHSAKEMKLSVGFRGSVFDVFLIPHTFIWMPLLGFHPFLVLIVDAIGKLYGVAVHINEEALPNRKGRWLEWLIITPSAHRVHHSTNPVYLDMNYGETFAIWDRIFGTYQAELPTQAPVYGTMKDIDSGDLYDSQMHEWRVLWRDVRSAPRFIDKARYLFMPPGWNPDGTGKMAKDLRKEALRALKKTDHQPK